MQKVNRIVKTVVAVLLSLAMITTCLVSGVFAKYVKKGEATFQSIQLKKWGLTVASKGTDLVKEYTSDGNVIVKSSTSINRGNDNIIMPGSSGRLAYFRIEGSPEVAYSIDFSGSIDIGDGFKKYIRDSEGQLIDYFPIILRFVAYDVSIVDDKEFLTEVAELTSPLITVKRTDVWGNEHYFDDNALDSIDLLESLMNSDSDISLNKAFDDLYLAPDTSINRIYALEWEWLYHYDTVEEVEAGKTENNREATASGDYQTKELDTKLGEAIVEKYNEFNISVDMDVTVKQVTGVPYELITEDGVKKIKFGSYPQSLVSDSDLANTLLSKAGTTLPTADGPNNWTSYGYYQNGSNSEDYMWYIDVEDGGEKYRGVYFTSYRPESSYALSSVENSFQDDNSYFTGEVYWFEYEPITWTIIEETSRETAFILCDMIVDSQAFQNICSTAPLNQSIPLYNPLDNADYRNPYGYDRIYANNYEYSTIRKWLNETFYETAFSELQDSIILDTYVDNSREGTKYADSHDEAAKRHSCANTLNKVFLLSDSEVSALTSQQRQATGYAKVQGLSISSDNGPWMLRTFFLRGVGDLGLNSHAIRYFKPEKSTYNSGWYVYESSIGVVPALWIKL